MVNIVSMIIYNGCNVRSFVCKTCNIMRITLLYSNICWLVYKLEMEKSQVQFTYKDFNLYAHKICNVSMLPLQRVLNFQKKKST